MRGYFKVVGPVSVAPCQGWQTIGKHWEWKRCERLTAADIRIAPRRRSSGRTLGNYLGFEGPVFPWGGRGGDCEAGPVCAALRPRALDDDTPAAASDQVAAPWDSQCALLDQGPERIDDRLRVGVGVCLGPRRSGGKPRGKRLLADLLAHGLPQRIELAAMPLGHRSIIGSERSDRTVV